jgi:hypothetical protein
VMSQSIFWSFFGSLDVDLPPVWFENTKCKQKIGRYSRGHCSLHCTVIVSKSQRYAVAELITPTSKRLSCSAYITVLEDY